MTKWSLKIDDYSHVSDSLITSPVIPFLFSIEIMNYAHLLLISGFILTLSGISSTS